MLEVIITKKLTNDSQMREHKELLDPSNLPHKRDLIEKSVNSQMMSVNLK